MKLSVPFCGGSSASAASPKASNKNKSVKRSKDGKKSGGGNSSFNITSASSHVCTPVVTTPRTMLLPSSPPQGVAMASSRKPPALAPVVTREELEVALRRVVSSKEELAEILTEVDGGIVADVVAVEGDEGDLREAFAVFDTDGDGRISAEELHVVLASLGDDLCSVDDCRRMISDIDVDGDGFVCFDEFSRMMMHGL